MAMDNYAVVKVAGKKPETFILGWLDSGLPKGSFMKTSNEMSEKRYERKLEKMVSVRSEPYCQVSTNALSRHFGNGMNVPEQESFDRQNADAVIGTTLMQMLDCRI
jgi:hypothetical protein